MSESTPPEASADDSGSPHAGRRRRAGFFRRHKVLTTLLALVLVVVVAVGGWISYLTVQIGDAPRFDLGLGEDEHLAKRVDGDSMNILLAGADNDNAAGTLAEALDQDPDDWQMGVFRSDTIMVLHIDADRRSAQAVSIPRDTYVEVPGYGKTKINAAFSYGGPRLMVQTIEAYTGMHIDHVAMVDLEGFSSITQAIGGVDVYIPRTVTDGYRDSTWTKGWHTIEGDRALLYVRQRKGLPGGDFDRVQRQQNFLRTVFDKVFSAGTLTNPVKVTKLASGVSGYLVLDSGFSGGEVRSLALSSRHLRPKDLTFATIPVTGTPTIDGASVVTADDAMVKKMFSAMANDEWAAFAAKNDVTLLPPPTDID